MKWPGEIAVSRAVTHTDYCDPVQMRRAYKFLLRPTSKQVAALEACLEDNRLLYNAALEERREAWRMGRYQVSFYSQDAQLKDIRKADPQGQCRWSSQLQKETVRRLDRAFQAFYRRCKAGEKPGYPRFKGRGWFNSLTWPTHGNGCKWDSVPHPTVIRIYLLGIGHIRVRQHRSIQGHIKTVTVKREGRRWYVTLSCDGVPAEPLPATGAAVGIDMGVAHFLTTSKGAHAPNPRYLAASADKLATAQQALARKKRGSKRRRKAVARVAALHAKVRRSRLDFAHKTALTLVRDHDLVAHEALKIANMTRSASGTLEKPGTNVAAKSGLNRSILDAGWGVFLKVLHGKAESAGRVVIEVPAHHTSQRCARCGYVAAGNRVTQAQFRCLSCGHSAHADVNAAENILRAGLALQAAEAA